MIKKMIDKLEYADSFIKKILNIEWNLGNTCPYKCNYCHPEHYNGSNPWVNFDQTINFIDRVQDFYIQKNKSWIYWQFSGGEPTVYKDFLKLTEYISSKNNNVCSVVSNGSRSIKYWEKASKFLMFTTLSVHLEYADIKHITNLADMLTDLDVIVNVMVMMDPKKWDEGVNAIDYMLSSRRTEWAIKTGALVHKDPSFDDIVNQPYTYTPDQLLFLNKSIKRQQKIVRKDFPFPNLKRKMIAIYKENTFDFEPAHAVVNDESKWKDYYCNIGIDRIYINDNGELKLGSGCGMEYQGFTKKKFYEEFEFPKSPTLCQQERCSCLSDVMVEKWIKRPLTA